MDSDIGRNTDIISKLPDSLLCHILSFLPTKYAVGTSILSTRWLYLWTSVTTLEFDDSDLLHKRRGMKYRDKEALVNLHFANFVSTVLLLSDVSSLEKFSLKFELLGNFDLVGAWILAAIKRNVRKLELRYSIGHELYGEVLFQLPRMIFTSKTLVDLTLDGYISVKIPDSVWLPSLKILNLEEVKYENGDSAEKLFSGCPVLEDLRIYRSSVDRQKLLNISVPTLKHLAVIRLGKKTFDSESMDVADDQHHKVLVNTPKLECLHLTDYEAEDFSLETLSSLLEATIAIGPSCSGPVSSTNILKLLCEIAHVEFLDLFTNVDDYVLPTFHTFHNLTHLRLHGGKDGWNLDLLNKFLQYSPNLQVLVLYEGPRVRGSTKSWSPPLGVPTCLLLHLWEIEIVNFCGYKYEFEVIEYLLKSAGVLEKMTIDCRTADGFFWRELARFPRGSKSCQLVLL